MSAGSCPRWLESRGEIRNRISIRQSRWLHRKLISNAVTCNTMKSELWQTCLLVIMSANYKTIDVLYNIHSCEDTFLQQRRMLSSLRWWKVDLDKKKKWLWQSLQLSSTTSGHQRTSSSVTTWRYVCKYTTKSAKIDLIFVWLFKVPFNCGLY